MSLISLVLSTLIPALKIHHEIKPLHTPEARLAFPQITKSSALVVGDVIAVCKEGEAVVVPA